MVDNNIARRQEDNGYHLQSISYAMRVLSKERELGELVLDLCYSVFKIEKPK